MSVDIPFGPCYIINVQGGLAMDLDLNSEGNHYTKGYKVSSRDLHGRENQQWLFRHKKSGGWTIENAASRTYLGFPEKKQPEQGKDLVCSVERAEYNIGGNKWDGFVIAARWPDPKMVIDLANGDAKDGARIVFWPNNGGQNQKWLIMPLIYREQLYQNFLYTEQTLGIFMRIRNVKTGLVFDANDPNGWISGRSFKHQGWLIIRGKTGYLIQDTSSKKYIRRTEDSWMQLSADNGTEFLFDGDEDHGFFIILADDLTRALELQGGSSTEGTWVQDVRARRQRWEISYPYNSS